MSLFYIGSFLSIVVYVALSYFNLGLGTSGNTVVAFALAFAFFFFGGANVVNEWARRPYMMLGKYKGEMGPGFCWINPAVCYALDDVVVRDQATPINIESVQTSDNVPLSFLLVITSRISDVRKSVLEVSDIDRAVSERAKSSASGTIRGHELSAILAGTGTFGDQILSQLKEKLSLWGVEVKAVEIKDIKIKDPAIEQAIAMKARARKEAEAELTRAEMQEQIAKQLDKAADALDEGGWTLKKLEVLLELCRSANNNTILIPSDILSLANMMKIVPSGGPPAAV